MTQEKWRDIESAPKDGDVFIARTWRGVCRARWCAVHWGEPMEPVCYWWDNPDDSCWFETQDDVPTGWIPMPCT